jgi:hypothetical protein
MSSAAIRPTVAQPSRERLRTRRQRDDFTRHPDSNFDCIQSYRFKRSEGNIRRPGPVDCMHCVSERFLVHPSVLVEATEFAWQFVVNLNTPALGLVFGLRRVPRSHQPPLPTTNSNDARVRTEVS